MTGRRWVGGIWLLVVLAPRLGKWADRNPDLLVSILLIGAALLLLWWGFRRSRAGSAPDVPAVVFIEGAEPPPPDSTCLICRHALAGDVIHCARCHTPHHRACFVYLGACSVYACGNRQPRKAA